MSRGINLPLAPGRDEPTGDFARTDGSTPAVATADFGFLRLRAVDYSEGDLKQWVETIHRIGADWRQAFVFFKHEEAATGPALAQQLQTLLNR